MSSIPFQRKSFSQAFVFILLVTCPLWGQVNNKRNVTEEEYHLWGSLFNDQISKDGQWAVFSMNYDSGLDTLFLKNTNDLSVFTFPKGYKGEFNTTTQCFAYRIKQGGIGIFNILKKHDQYFPNAKKYLWSNAGDFIALYFKDEKLRLWNLKEDTQIELEGIKEFYFNSDGDRLAFIQKKEKNYQVSYIDMKVPKRTINVYQSLEPLVKLKWHQNKNSFIFLEEFKQADFKEKSHIIHYYDQSLRSFDHRKQADFPKNMFVSKVCINEVSDLFISKNSDRVFFPVQLRTAISDSIIKSNTNDVEIWHYKDVDVFPRKLAFEHNKSGVKLGSWDLGDNRFFRITSPEHPFYILNKNHTHALVYSLHEYLPSFKHHGLFSDYYLIDLKKQKMALFLKKQSTAGDFIVPSPDGNSFAYFRDRLWWIYDLKKGKHINISEGVSEPLYKKYEHSAVETIPISYPAWTKAAEDVFISGQHDIWKVNLKRKETSRMTNGQAKGFTYEVFQGASLNKRINQGLTIENLNRVMVKGIDSTTRYTGYFSLSKDKALTTITFGDIFVNELALSKDASVVTYTQQRFDAPSTLKVWRNGEAKELFQSNRHHEKFHWGTSKIINYTSTAKDSLQGILYYPADFNPQKKYPLIVHPYERMTNYYNLFYRPSIYANDESLTTEFTLNGYFVLLPDIAYQEGNVGISASDCVVAATEKALEYPFIDAKAIGLMGHSFGGYETNFIISQTNLFSAAISGSGFSELFSWSLSVLPGFSNRTEMDYFEFGQSRMGKPFYESMENYIANSPIHQVKKIDTPLLIWFGKEDVRVNWEQGLYMHIALRRLQKEHILLVYPKESHVLTQKANQVDLSHKIMDWFDHYLKNKNQQDWMILKNK